MFGVQRKHLFLFSFSLIAWCGASFCHAEEVFDSAIEAEALQNIRQLTFHSMGFEKAGEAYFSPDGKNILFQAVPHGSQQYQIYGMNLEEGIPRLVSTGRGACTCAYFRPDGKKIIFASSHEDRALNSGYNPSAPGYKREGGNYSWEFTPYMNIYEANPDGSDLVALTTGPAYHAECAYSPDGSRIVFASNVTGSMNIFTMRADGSDVRQVTHTTYSYNGGPFFSPDGKKILFRADREKQHYLQVYTINTDGTNERQVTANHAVNWAPYWHPRGDVIAFTTSLHGHHHYEIYLLNIETGTDWRLTHNPTFDGLPVFSQDGKKMMWTSKRGPDATCQLFIADFIMPEKLNEMRENVK
jgi:Tol biopolymer transport system component